MKATERPANEPEFLMRDEGPVDAIAAATLIVMRDPVGDKGSQILMLRRAKSMRFAAGAIVFPGGRVDGADLEFARMLPHGLPLSDAAARIAAIRETLEEAGVAIGLRALPAQSVVDALRAGLRSGTALAGLLERYGLTLDLGALTPFSRWRPGQAEQLGISRVFDTRFYVAKAPRGACQATVDQTENDRLFWGTAAEIIADCDAGTHCAMFPTLRNLERVALGGNHDEVVAHARRYRIETVMPWVEKRDGEWHLCIPGHLGYPIQSQIWSTIYRG